MSKAKVLSLFFAGVVLLAFTGAGSTDKPTGPFGVKLEISHLPQLNEEAALICSVTSVIEVDSGLVGFWATDTSVVKLVKGQKEHYCKFKKGETKEFKWTISFTNEAILELGACAHQFFPTSGAQGNCANMYVKTYKDKKAVLLERMPWTLPDKAFYDLRFPGRRDSVAASSGSLRVKQR
jgi:hypothetical protein